MKIKYLVLSLCIFCITTQTIYSQTAGVPVSEYNALKDFYENMNGDNWTVNDNWLDTINHTVEDWHGVWIKDGHVSEIGFNNNNVSGSIPQSIINLTQLEKVVFNKCNIENKISDNLVKITTLKDLFARECNISDTLNNIMANSHDSLQFLNVENNHISGTIPENIGDRYFKEIWISDNNISGEIPSSIGDLENLFVFYAGDNQLTGKIPAEFGNITGIQTVILSNNNIEGPLPSELKNLVNLEDFVLDHNKIGAKSGIASTTEKNALIEPERQIPDDLSNLIALQQLKVDNNNLMFNDVEPIFSWSAYSQLTEFSYSPQAKIGIEKNINKLVGNNINLTIDNYYPGDSDTYQWYKNGSLLSGETSATLNLTNLETNDTGVYYCEVSNPVANELMLTSENITLNVTELHGAGVPVSEYNALKTFFAVMDGLSWENNNHWLDTTFHSVSDWYGITVENNHVTKIKLVNNLLDGVIQPSFSNLTKLQEIELDSNMIHGKIEIDFGVFEDLEKLSLTRNQITGQIPDGLGKIFGLKSIKLSANQLSGEIPSRLINCKELVEFHVDSNMYTTLHLEPVFRWGNLYTFEENFLYAPQYDIGESKTITKNWGDALNLEIKNYQPGSADLFQWFKDSVTLPGETSSQLLIEQVTSADSGVYFCQVTNEIVTGLTLSSKPIKVVVNGAAAGPGVPLKEYLALVEIYDTTMGANWNNNHNWLDTIFHTVNDWYGISVDYGHVVKFEMPGNNLTHMPFQLNKFAELEVIDLSDGNFTDSVPNYGGLDGLLKLNVGGNKYNFKQLTPITEWFNYNNFKDSFIYTPQPTEIGHDSTIVVKYSDSLEIAVNGYDADENDNFEWFKNGVSVQDGPEKPVKKKAWFDDHKTVYYCEVTNNLLPDLTLISGNYTVNVQYSSNDSIALANLRMNYDTLKDIWTGDTIFNWPLVTAEKGFVKKLDLSELKLEGEISEWFTTFDSLNWLNLSNNHLSGIIPGLGATKSAWIEEEPMLKFLDISNNNFVFADLEPSASILNAINDFKYSPQAMVGIPLDTTLYKYQNINLRMWNYNPGFADEYWWYKNGELVPGKNSLIYVLENVALSDSGMYTFSITNTLFPDLTLVSDTIRLKIAIPVGISEIPDNEFNVYPNPAEKRIFIDTKNKNVDLKIYNLQGKLMIEKSGFNSEWIEVSGFTKGIYLVRITTPENQFVNQKIIIK